MATYLQGVTDYIPEFQPFQPDLNFYANAMQTKQNQYDTNYKAVNNLYGQLYDADLTHDRNIEKKSELLKNIDFNLKRVSGLDLSLEQNVTQAQQVFKPFYEDKYLMKDMAFTKNYNSRLGAAQALENNKDEKLRAQYWDTGIQEMQYKREEFKNADIEKTLNMGDVQYTPYVNAAKLYRDLAKEMDLSVDVTKPDASGMYMVRQKNGELILPSLQKLFLSEYTNNPALQKVYATQAYVNRNNHILQNAEKFKGDKVAAEKDYLQQQYKFLSDYAAKRAQAHEEATQVTTNKKNVVTTSIEQGDVNPSQSGYLARLEQAFHIDKSVSDNSSKLNSDLNGESRTTTTQGPNNAVGGLDLNNMELARLKVDSGMAAYNAEVDIADTANYVSNIGAVFEQDFSKLYMENLNHSHAMQRDAIRDQRADARELRKIQAAKQLERDKHLISSGVAIYDPEGNVIPNPVYAANVDEGQQPGGTDVVIDNIKKDNTKLFMNQAVKMNKDYAENFFNHVNNALEEGLLTKTEVASLLKSAGSSKIIKFTGDPVQDFKSLYKKFKADPDEVTKNLAVSGKLEKFRDGLNNWAIKNKGAHIADAVLSDPSQEGAEDFQRFYAQHLEVKKINDEKIDNALMKSLSDTGYKDQTKKEIINLYKNKLLTGQIDEDQFDDLVGKYIVGKYEKGRITSSNKDYVGIKHKDAGSKDFDFSLGNMARGSYGAGVIQNSNESNEISELAKLKDAYYSIVSNPNAETGLLSYASTLVKGPNGKATTGARSTSQLVNLGAPGTAGFNTFFETLNDINRINWKQDTSKYKILLDGNIKETDESDNLNVEAQKYKDLLRELSYTVRDKKKPGDFKIVNHQVASENKNLSGMTIFMPREFLEKHLKGDDGKVDHAAVNQIVANGITFIAPTSEWNNSLHKGNEITPTQALINAKGKLPYNNPNNAGKYNIEKVSDNNYRANFMVYEMNDEGKMIKHIREIPSEQMGNNVDLVEKLMLREIQGQNEDNLKKYREFHAANNEEAMKNAQKYFGFTPKQFGWKY